MTNFPEKKELIALYWEWLKDSEMEESPLNFIFFLCGNDLLNTENALSLIARMKGAE